MRRTKRFSFILVLILLLSVFPTEVMAAKYNTITAAAGLIRSDLGEHKAEITSYVKTTLGDTQTVYEQLAEEVFKETDVPYEGDYMYWDIDRRNIYCTRTVQTGRTTYYYYMFQGQYEYMTTLKQRMQVDAEVERAIEGFGFTSSTSDYEKIKTIYDYVCTNVAYPDKTEETVVYTAWGALFNREAVCQGYAQLLYRMFKEVGISSRVIAGYGTSTDVNHGWNIVKLGDYYYNLDATWDAARVQNNKSYHYFLKGDSFSSHTRFSNYKTAAFYTQYPMAANDYSSTKKQTASVASQRAAFQTIKPKFVSASRKRIRLKKIAGAYRYQIRYATNPKMTKHQQKLVTKKRTIKLKKLKKHQKYYVKFRAYRMIGKKKTYTKWSKKQQI